MAGCLFVELERLYATVEARLGSTVLDYPGVVDVPQLLSDKRGLLMQYFGFFRLKNRRLDQLTMVMFSLRKSAI